MTVVARAFQLAGVLTGLALFWLSSVANSAPRLRASAPPLRVDEPLSLSKVTKAAMENALIAFAKGDLTKARKGFETILRTEPDNLTSLVNLGVIEYRLSRDQEAEKLLKRALRLNPELAPGWTTLGLSQQRLGKTDAALASLAQATALEPNDARAHAALAVTLVTKGWMSGAEMELQRAVEIEPELGEAHFNLALLYLDRAPPAVELARRHYQRALDLGEDADPTVDQKLAAVP